MHIELERTPQGCPECGPVASVKDRDLVQLVDLAVFGRPTKLLWHKRRLRRSLEFTPLIVGQKYPAGNRWRSSPRSTTITIHTQL